MTSLVSAVPEFAVVLRGYDRIQVDEYVNRLGQLIEESEERVRDAERSREDQALAEVGPRISQIFDLARAEALDVREGAQSEAEIILSAARREAAELVAAAQDEARAVGERAEANRLEVVAAQQAECEALEARARQLESRRDAVLGELRRLRDTLSVASGTPDAPAPVAVSEPPDAQTLEIAALGEVTPAPTEAPADVE